MNKQSPWSRICAISLNFLKRNNLSVRVRQTKHRAHCIFKAFRKFRISWWLKKYLIQCTSSRQPLFKRRLGHRHKGLGSLGPGLDWDLDTVQSILYVGLISERNGFPAARSPGPAKKGSFHFEPPCEWQRWHPRPISMLFPLTLQYYSETSEQESVERDGPSSCL